MRTQPALHLIDDAAVAAAFDAFPDEARARLLELRALILDTAASIDGVGPLEETLRWGEPAYLTSTSGAGTTVRLGWKAARPDRGALLVNCRTTLIDTFRTLHPELAYEGNRAISFAIDAPLPEEALARCLTLALTYHRRRRP